jgi:hypothetical protein
MADDIAVGETDASEHRLIEFHAGGHARWPAPMPAAQAIPQWLKEMPMEVAAGGGQILPSVKKCPPFVEAMTCGYLMPLPGEVTFTMDATGRLSFECEGPMLDAQPAVQYAGTPFGGAVVVKFINPWLIRTPPGFSTLIVPPLNRFEIPFQILSGVVETDLYYREVAFPALCLMRPGQQVRLPRATPIAQAIPFRRDAWRSAAGEWEHERRHPVEQAFAANPHLYKQECWRKKSYE